MTEESRPYRMKRRAESQQETRLRITRSAVALHGTLGPSRTSMSAIAEHAGVRRSTLYRHFADEAALFDACTAHWARDNPPPDLAVWAELAEPEERLAAALTDLYGYYGRTAAMFENLFRDEATMPLVRERFAAFRGYFEASQHMLIEGRRLRGARRQRVNAAIGHAIAFSTWRSLVREQGLDDSAAIGLMRALVRSAADG
jgi:AcrR family transcriptional regulator